MSVFSHSDELFNDSGCLSQETLNMYIRQLLSKEDTKQVEEHLASCPLCSDAMEGLSFLNEDALEFPEIPKPETGIRHSIELDDLPNMSEPKTEIRYSIELDDMPAIPPEIVSRTMRLNMRMRRRFNYDPYRSRPSRRGPFIGNLLIPAAASIIILLGIIGYFHYFFPENNELAMAGKEETPVITEEREIKHKNEEVPATSQASTNKTTVGGVFKDSEVANKAEDMLAGGDVSVEEENTGVIVVEDEPEPKEEIILADAEEDISIAKPEATDEVDVAYAAEEFDGEAVMEERIISTKSNAKGSRKKTDQEAVFTLVDQMPEFPGGMDSLQAFLIKNLQYPLSEDDQAEVHVVVEFLVTKKGKIKDIIILRSGGKAFDDEVIRVIKLMPDWIPGKQRGKDVSVKYALPVLFKNE